MARTDSLYITADVSSEEVTKILFRTIHRKCRIQEVMHLGKKLKFARIPQFSAFPEDLSAGYKLSHLDMHPTVMIVFHPSQEVDWDIPKAALIRAVMGLTPFTEWDFALHLMDSEFVGLLYRHGHLALDSKHNFWTPSRLELVTYTYVMEELPDP